MQQEQEKTDTTKFEGLDLTPERLPRVAEFVGKLPPAVLMVAVGDWIAYKIGVECQAPLEAIVATAVVTVVGLWSHRNAQTDQQQQKSSFQSRADASDGGRA